jgi:hypothetical protein
MGVNGGAARIRDSQNFFALREHKFALCKPATRWVIDFIDLKQCVTRTKAYL